MRNVTWVLVGAAVMGWFAGLATGAEAKPAALYGTVVKVEGTKVVVEKTTKTEVTVTTDKKTRVTIDDHKAKVSELKAGMRVLVILAEGHAIKIEAKSTPKTKPKTKK